MKEKKTGKMRMKEKLGLAIFMESVPSIIKLWKTHAPEVPFDEFCMMKYEEGKAHRKSK